MLYVCVEFHPELFVDGLHDLTLSVLCGLIGRLVKEIVQNGIAPEQIAIEEIGSEQHCKSLCLYLFNKGIPHLRDVAELRSNRGFRQFIRELEEICMQIVIHCDQVSL